MKRRIVRTVLGDISPEELGFVDCHCHPLVISEHLLQYNASYFDVRDIEIAALELLKFKKACGKSIVDCQPIATGRATEQCVELSKRTGLNIIASTGFHMKAFYPEDHWTFTMSEEQLSDIYVAEINEGMYINTEFELPSTQIVSKAGFIKNATEEADFDEIDARRLKAVAKAAKITGAPLLCHTNRSALTHIPFLLNLGIDPKQIIVAHLDKSNLDPYNYHMEIAKMGVYLEFDSIVNSTRNTIEQEIKLIKTMIENGYEQQLLFGSDPVRPTYRSYNDNGWGLNYILDTFIGLLLRNGVSSEAIHDITITNPMNAFAFTPTL
ncbi:MAG: hypothetical protein FWG21_04370 [Oscillospiraceae bacterium]|nr:hypothetical protein [Oscillospiraceae bacterium]